MRPFVKFSALCIPFHYLCIVNADINFRFDRQVDRSISLYTSIHVQWKNKLREHIGTQQRRREENSSDKMLLCKFATRCYIVTVCQSVCHLVSHAKRLKRSRCRLRRGLGGVHGNTCCIQRTASGEYGIVFIHHNTAFQFNITVLCRNSFVVVDLLWGRCHVPRGVAAWRSGSVVGLDQRH